MKATINGITVEGTPEEVHAFMQIQQQSEKTVNPYARPTYDWYRSPTNSNKCPNGDKACNCTGECRGITDQTDAGKFSVSYPYARS